MKQNFVAVAVDAHIRDFQDAEVAFCKSTDCVPEGAVASGTVRFITASGKKLERGELAWIGKTNWFQLSAQRALKAWAALPLAERQPGGVQVPDRPPLDPKRAATLKPPEGALIVHLYNRQLGRDAKGELRYTVADDYVPALHKIAPAEHVGRPLRRGGARLPVDYPARMAGHDAGRSAQRSRDRGPHVPVRAHLPL